MNKTVTQISTSAKALATLVALLCVVLASIGLFWYWSSFVYSGFREVVMLSSAETDVVQQNRLQALRKEVRETATMREKLHSLTLAEEQVPQLLNKLEALEVGEVQVFVRSVRVVSEQLQVSLAFSGDFAEVTSIVQAIAQVRSAVHIDSFEMRRDSPSVWDVTLRIELPLISQ